MDGYTLSNPVSHRKKKNRELRRQPPVVIHNAVCVKVRHEKTAKYVTLKESALGYVQKM